MSIRTFELSFGKAEENQGFGAEVSLFIPWNGLPENQQEVAVELFVDHNFMGNLPVALTLQIIAHRADQNEECSYETVEVAPQCISYYPPATHTISLTLEDFRVEHFDETLSKVHSQLLEQFVNMTVEHTTCTLTHNEETGMLTASLRWKQSGDLIVETIFTR